MTPSEEGHVAEVRPLAPPIRPVDPDLPVADVEHPRAGVRVRRRRRLQKVAATQFGLFTVGQADAAGLDRRARHHHLSYGNWRRSVAPGVLRLTAWPDDADEHLRAWLFWAGAGVALTSWSALEVHGLLVMGPRSTVHLTSTGRRPGERRRPERMERPAAVAVGQGPGTGPDAVRWHRVRNARDDDLSVRDLTVRAVEEAFCIAAMTTPRRSAGAELLDTLFWSGRVDLERLRWTALDLGATRVTERLFARSGHEAG